MGKILVFCEFSGNQLKRGSTELLSAAKKSGNEVSVLALGPGAKAITDKMASYGANQTAYICEDEKLKDYNPEYYTAVIADAITKSGAEIVLASSSMLARDVFPRIAARLDAGCMSDCTELTIEGSNVTVRRPMYAGKCSAEVQFTSALKIVLMRPNQLPAGVEETGQSITTEELQLAVADVKTTIQEVKKGESEKIDLTEANVIISGGRGMKGPEHFAMLEQLASTVGATVGASRAVTDAGWVPHSMQVGQTGKTVAPSLYIACGISGAIQHLAGMSGSKVIVAINKDADAPIFQKATYGIVGDVFEVVPHLNEEFKKALH